MFCVCFGHTTLFFIIKIKNVFLIKTRFYQKSNNKDYAKLRFSSKTFNSFNNAILLFIVISGEAQESACSARVSVSLVTFQALQKQSRLYS